MIQLEPLDGGMVAVRWGRPEDGGLPVISPNFLEALEEVLAHIEKDKPAGVMFGSAEPGTFLAGADLKAVRGRDARALHDFLCAGQRVFDRIAALPMPTVATVDGVCLGGGLELALACDARVVSDRPGTRIGLPEVQLGIVPGWGGTVRLPRTIGLIPALQLIPTGKQLRPHKARKLGVVDACVPPEKLHKAALRLLTRPPKRRGLKWWERFFGQSICDKASRKAYKASPHFHAPSCACGVIARGLPGAQHGLDAERMLIGQLADQQPTQHLFRLFFLRAHAKHVVVDRSGDAPVRCERVLVVGGGVMGSGIAAELLRAGLRVVLLEVNGQAAAEAGKRVADLLAGARRRGQMTRHQHGWAQRRLRLVVDRGDIGPVDAVLEAATEKLALKQQILGELSRRFPQVPVLTNTSSLRLSELAVALEDPTRLGGLHFFNPVGRMPLVEMVSGKQTAAATLAMSAAIGKRMGKVVVPVGDGPGFAVNRVLFPMLAEALAMAEEGLPVAAVDKAFVKFGMPMGPYRLMDTIGLDVVAAVMGEAATSIETPGKGLGLPERMAEQGLCGGKRGGGFWTRQGKRFVVNPAAPLPAACRQEVAAPPDAVDRLVMPMLRACAQVLEGGIASDVGLLDLACVMGLGWAPHRGGPCAYARQLGLDTLQTRMHQLAEAHGAHHAPIDALSLLMQEDDFLDTPTDGGTS